MSRSKDATHDMAIQNPYAAPSNDLGPESDTTSVCLGNLGKVRLVALVSGLNSAQGTMEILFGSFLVARMPAVAAVVRTISPVGFEFSYDLVFAGIITILSGFIRVIASWQNFRFRSRGLGLTSYLVGILSAFSVCCGPTGILLALYGCVVLHDRYVAFAYLLGRNGYTRQQILGYSSRM